MTTEYGSLRFIAGLVADLLHQYSVDDAISVSAPLGRGRSAENGRFANAFFVISRLYGDEIQISDAVTGNTYSPGELAEIFLEHALNDRVYGYLLYGVFGDIPEAMYSADGIPFEYFYYTKDSRIRELIETTAFGFVGKHPDGYNWPLVTDAHTGYTVPANLYDGTYWGTINQEAYVLEFLTKAYLIYGTDAYRDQDILNMIYNIIKFIEGTQRISGYWPRESGGIEQDWYYTTYSTATATYLATTLYVINVFGEKAGGVGHLYYGDVDLNTLILNMLYNHEMGLVKQFGSNIPVGRPPGFDATDTTAYFPIYNLLRHMPRLYMEGNVYPEGAFALAYKYWITASSNLNKDTGFLYYKHPSDPRLRLKNPFTHNRLYVYGGAFMDYVRRWLR